tara:strand:- start:3821 stop:4072 length:252 start_codon:yes stop_codon:yes gene_type:complete
MEPLFKNREIEVNPTVLIREDHPSKNDFSFKHKILVGMFFRVIPSTAREVFFIQGLVKNYVVFTPENGDGLIISPSCLKGMKQ